MLKSALTVAMVESVTVTVTWKPPVKPGVPAIKPLFVLESVEMPKPGGVCEPEPDFAAQFQVNGFTPPVAVSVKPLPPEPYKDPATPLIGLPEVIRSAAGAAITMLSVAEAVAPGDSESVTVTTTLKLPVAEGVPDINPVLSLAFVETFKPGGNEEPVTAAQLQVEGVTPPVAVSVKVPGAPTVKVVLFALVIAGAWFTVTVVCAVAEADVVAVLVTVSV